MVKYSKRGLIAVLIAAMVSFMFPSAAFAAADVADDIKFTVSSDEVLDFDEEKFNTACDDLTGEELNYVKFSLPDADEGVLYYKYDEDADEEDQTEVSTTKKYYYSSSSYLSDVTFVPAEDYTGTVTIEYKGYDVDGNSYEGEIKIKVEEETGSDILTYSIDDSDETVDFDKKDFLKVCDDVQNEDLDYVEFSLPDKDDGILYYDYDEDDDSNTKVGSGKKYYYDAKAPYISKITFVPNEDLSGTVTIKYSGYDIQGDKYSGKIKITVKDGGNSSSSEDGVVSYSVESSDQVVVFDKEDFNDACQEENDEDLDYIKITIPSATKGILYYSYSDGAYSSVVSTAKKYYYNQSQYISKITFVPDTDFKGVCKFDYKGYDAQGYSFPGVISISVGNSNKTATTITYTGKVNTPATFRDEDFNSACRDVMDSQLSYVTFTLPASSYGTLYYGYTADGNYTSKVKASEKYYYGGSPFLLNVSFVPADGVTGAVTISYTGYDKDELSYSGKVQINITSTGAPTTPGGSATLISSKYFKDVDLSYSWAVPYIDGLYDAGIISGSTSGTVKLYNPASSVTRGDFIYLLYKALNFKTSSTAGNFSDVPASSYYSNAILNAKALGIVQGSENKFYPNVAITREDAMVMVLRTVNITGKTIASGDAAGLAKYSDSGQISDYSKSAVAALVKAGIITGSDDNKIYPKGSLTRAQIAAIIYRVRNL